MAAFEYKALNSAGKTVSGIIDADNAKNARQKIKGQGLFPSEVKEQASNQKVKGKGLSTEIDIAKFFQRVSVQELAEFTSQLETLFRTSVDVAESLQILGEQTNNEMLRLALAEIRDEVRQGQSLSEAMKKHPKIFNNLYISLVEVGQESGNMDQVLGRLREYTSKMNEMRQKVFSAMAYPVLMGFISICVVLVMFLFIIPQISKVFDSFGATLPWYTSAVMWVSDFLIFKWYIPTFLSIIISFAFVKWKASESGRQLWDRFKLKAPIFGNLMRMIAISRFTRTLATLLNSGIPMAEALKTAKNVVGNSVLVHAIEAATENIIKGNKFSEPLAASGQFPPLLVRMLAIGERTGEMESMLVEASNTYEQRVDGQISALSSMLEPILIVSLGGFVGVIAICIIMPMMEISTIIK